jgi:CubicO group peptidase (beta-lactamase class C family)
MEEQGVPGLAVAVVDDEGVVWSEGFGVIDSHGSDAVTPGTWFSLQSTSKTFTATAVLLAVQDGLLELDEPITTYLPDFTVQSTFEDDPQSRITLRHLLSHTAGFTIEAPVGNNWDGDADSFDAHVASISDTWLRFPVGTGYAYSNLDIDLAGYILQRVTGQPFADYVREHLFEPLGMLDSSFEADVIDAAGEIAIGHVPELPHEFRPVPMVPSGGLYASVEDVARFLEFQLEGGGVDGRTVLDGALVDEMRTVQFPDRGDGYGYGLGVGRTGWYAGANADLFSHGGGGFGFRSDLWWLPELQLGIAVMFNSADHDLQGNLALEILDDLAHERPYLDRLRELPAHARVREDWGDWLPPPSLAADIHAQAIGPDPARWQPFLGKYQTVDLGALDITGPTSRLYEDGGRLYLDGSDTDDETYLLHEIEPGLFFTETAEVVDLRTEPPTFRNLELTRVGSGPAPVALALLVLCGLVMAAEVIPTPLRRLGAAHTNGSAERGEPSLGRALRLAVTGATVATGVAGLASIALVAVLPRIIYSGYIGWGDLPTVLEVWVRAPALLLVATVALAALVGWNWRRGWRADGQHWTRGALIAAAIAVVVMLVSWQMIGVA